eukprot:GHVR01149022.1.p1 GENE.GHVR01149022.1~~GHVR01149022.1.p1  ORF type:complete len:122 (+),score=23.88 GHVR01149022.1:337-702(+)
MVSPMRLIRSFRREVIERKPYMMKAEVLGSIRELFPSHSHPFFAGFGNRDTDHVAYTFVGVPEARVYIVNPKGAMARVQSKHGDSYHGMNEVVEEVFPPLVTQVSRDMEAEEKLRNSKRIA